jgi:hypothetical protein
MVDKCQLITADLGSSVAGLAAPTAKKQTTPTVTLYSGVFQVGRDFVKTFLFCPLPRLMLVTNSLTLHSWEVLLTVK